MIKKGLVLIAILAGLMACTPEKAVPTLAVSPSATAIGEPTEPNTAVSTQTPTIHETIEATTFPTATPLPPTPTHTPTPDPALNDLVSFELAQQWTAPAGRRLVEMTNGRFAIQTAHGFDLYDQFAPSSQTILLDNPRIDSARLSPDGNYLAWQTKNADLTVERLADGAILYQDTADFSRWHVPTFHFSPQATFGYVVDADVYQPEIPPVLTLWHMASWEVVAELDSAALVFSEDEQFFVREGETAVYIHATTDPALPLHTIDKAVHSSYLNLAISADGQAVAITSHFQANTPSEVQVYATESGALLGTYTLAEDETGASLSHDGNLLVMHYAVRDVDGNYDLLDSGARLIEVATGRLHATITAPPAPAPLPTVPECADVLTAYSYQPNFLLNRVEFAENGRFFTAVFTNDGSVITHLYDAETTNLLASVSGDEVAFVENGRYWLTLENGTLALLEMETAVQQTIAEYAQPINELALSPNGETVATVTDLTVDLRLADGTILTTYAEATAVTFVDNETIVLGYKNGRVEWRRIADDGLLTDFQVSNLPIMQLIMQQTEAEPTVAVLVENDCYLRPYRLTDGAALPPFDSTLHLSIGPYQESSGQVVLGENGRFVAGRAWYSYGFSVWDAETNQRLFAGFEDAPKRMTDMATSGDLLATGEWWPYDGPVAPENGGVRLWRVADGQVTLAWKQSYPSFVNRVAFGENGRLLAVGFNDGSVGVFYAETGQLLTALSLDGGGVSGLAFSGNGRFFTAANGDGVLSVWEIGE